MRSCALVLVAGACLFGQTVVPNGAPPSHKFDGQVDEWRGLPPTFSLHPLAPGARGGSIWVRQVPEGLLFAGLVDGGKPDHVQIWIAPLARPQFPPPGNGNDRQDVSTLQKCPDPECVTWFHATEVYRRQLSSVFVRQFDLTPGGTAETFAGRAFDEIVSKMKDRDHEYIDALKPAVSAKGQSASVQFAEAAGGGYSFEALIPWESFPPLDALALKNMRVMVDVADGPLVASTSATRKVGQPSSFNPVVLETGRKFKITACEYLLIGRNPSNESGPAIFFPRRDDKLTRVIRLKNFEFNYSYRLSPIAEITEFVEKPAPGGATVCGPRLAVARNNKIDRYPVTVDQTLLDVKPQPDGSLMVLSGPRWRRADKDDDDSCCEGLPVIEYRVMIIPPAGKMLTIFESHVVMSGIAMGIVDFGAEANEDASKIKTFTQWFNHQEQSSKWQETTFCRHGLNYTKCGENLDSPGPVKNLRK